MYLLYVTVHVVHCLKSSHQLIQKITVTLFGNCGSETVYHCRENTGLVVSIVADTLYRSRELHVSIFIHLQFEGTTYARMRFCDLYLTHCQSCELHYMDWAIPATEATVCWRHFVDSFWVLLIFSKYWHYFFVVFLFHKVCNVLVHLAHTVTYSCSDLNLSLSKQRAAVPCGDYCCDLAMNK